MDIEYTSLNSLIWTCVRVSAGYTGGGYHSGYHQSPPDNTPNHTAYSGGLTEEEQLEAAIRNSLNERGKRVLMVLIDWCLDNCINLIICCLAGQNNQRGAPPPYGFNLSEEARMEDIRLRRLRRFDSWTAGRQWRGRRRRRRACRWRDRRSSLLKTGPSSASQAEEEHPEREGPTTQTVWHSEQLFTVWSFVLLYLSLYQRVTLSYGKLL